ncbi:MAG: hypothetical protein ACOVMN_00890 [Flexibacteraceae bacterium]
MVFADSATKKPIPDLVIRYPENILFTDKKGSCVIADTTKSIVVSGLNYKLQNITAPFPATIYLAENVIQYGNVEIKKRNYKRPKVDILFARVHSQGCFLTTHKYYIKSYLVFSNGDFNVMRFKLSKSDLKKVTGNAEVQIEFRKVNDNWSDTAKALGYLNKEKVKLFNNIPMEERSSVGPLIQQINIPVSDIKSDYIDIPLETILKTETEVFVGIGLVKFTNPVNEYPEIFKLMVLNSRLIAEDYGHFNCPLSYLSIFHNDRLGKIGVPYFELLEVK